MEKEGLIRCLSSITNATVEELVTDRHSQVKTFLHDVHSEIRHSFDTWHIAKGFRKKLSALSKKMDCEIVAPWINSLINQLYQCARRGNGDPDLNEEIWRAVGNHVLNIHHHPDNINFRACEHLPLTDDRLWFQPGSTAYLHLREIMYSIYMLKDIKQLSSTSNTAGNETFNALLNHYCPKLYHFHYFSQRARMQIAVLHFNENTGREQKRSHTGAALFSVKYPKYMQRCSVRKVMESATYDYFNQLTTEVIRRINERETAWSSPMEKPPSLASLSNKVPRDEAIRAQKSRYSNNHALL